MNRSGRGHLAGAGALAVAVYVAFILSGVLGAVRILVFAAACVLSSLTADSPFLSMAASARVVSSVLMLVVLEQLLLHAARIRGREVHLVPVLPGEVDDGFQADVAVQVAVQLDDGPVRAFLPALGSPVLWDEVVVTGMPSPDIAAALPELANPLVDRFDAKGRLIPAVAGFDATFSAFRRAFAASFSSLVM